MVEQLNDISIFNEEKNEGKEDKNLASRMHPRLHDIKPKTASADASFLAPDKFSFDLNHTAKKNHGPHRWLKFLAYFLSTVVVLMSISLVVLSYYSQKILDQSSRPTPASVTAEKQAKDYAASPTAFLEKRKFSIAVVNARPVTYDLITKNLTSQFKDQLTVENKPSALPAALRDMLYFKKEAQGQSSKILGFLGQFGLSPSIQENKDIQTDFLLYLTDNPQAVNLSGRTSAIYNASGKAGAAKKLCSAILSYKADSCTPLNATSAQQGTKVFYKDQKSLVAASRIKELQNASFAAAEKSQIEDLRIVTGK